MEKIQQQLNKIKSEKRLGLMTHLVLGYPSLTASRKIALVMDREGVDFIELQIPFSDPIGDGPTIRQANTRALANGFKVKNAFTLAKKLTAQDKIKAPLLFMTYYNIIFNYGVKKFCQDTKKSGVSGLIIPDYNPRHEKHEKLGYYCQQHKLELINFIAPQTKNFNTKNISSSFIYCFSSQSVTGSQKKFNDNLSGYLKKIKQHTSRPLAIGFGISTTQQIQMLRRKADIAIVGSALLAEYQQHGQKGLKIKVKKLINALH